MYEYNGCTYVDWFLKQFKKKRMPTCDEVFLNQQEGFELTLI